MSLTIGLRGRNRPLDSIEITDILNRIEALESKPALESLFHDVTDLFTFQTTGDVAIYLKKRKNETHKPSIEIEAMDTSGQLNDLSIIAPFGFGSYYGFEFPVVCKNENDYIVKNIVVTPETENIRSTIMVPAGVVHTTGFSYFIGQSPGQSSTRNSYWVDLNGDYHSFELENTPIANFCYNGGSASSVLTINGNSVVKNTIKEIFFGSSYKSVKDIPDLFLTYMNSLSKISIFGFTGVTSVGSSFITRGIFNSIDLSPISSIRNIGQYFLNREDSLSHIDITPLKNAFIQPAFLFAESTNRDLSMYIGDMDGSNFIIGGDTHFNGRNRSENIIYADTQANGDAFKARFTNLSNWQVIVGQPPT